MTTPKPYARLALTESEFESLHSAAIQARRAAFGAWAAALDPKEKAFYADRMVEWGALLAKFEARRVADTSQDAPEDEEDDEDEDA